MKKRILITGSNGLLGSSLIVRGCNRYELIGLSKEQELLSGLPRIPYRSVDITDASVQSMIVKEKPDGIIHTAAYTDVDGAEKQRDLAYAINVLGTKYIRDAAATLGIPLVFISTDYVFDGDHGPYRETDIPAPKSYYGETKLEGEHLVQELGDHGLVCRTQILYGYRPGVRQNFVLWVKKSLEEGKDIHVVDDQIGSPTFADNLADMIFDLIDHEHRGVYHTSGPDVIDRYHFALKIAETFSLSSTHIHRSKTDVLHQAAPRPKQSPFIVDKIRQSIATQPMSIDEGLRKMKEQFFL